MSRLPDVILKEGARKPVPEVNLKRIFYTYRPYNEKRHLTFTLEDVLKWADNQGLTYYRKLSWYVPTYPDRGFSLVLESDECWSELWYTKDNVLLDDLFKAHVSEVQRKEYENTKNKFLR